MRGLDYATVKKKLDDYFIPQRNVIYERALFNSRKQEPGEPVEEFITHTRQVLRLWRSP